MSQVPARPDPTFLAPPGEVVDWRMVVLFDALAASGALAALPATAEEAVTAEGVAVTAGLDGHAVGVVLDALTAWDVVGRDASGRYALGSQAPDADTAAGLRHHARALRSWAGSIESRLRGEPVQVRPGMADPELFIDALAVNGRRSAPLVVDLCLERFPAAKTAIDLGGGHGEYALEFARRGLSVTLQDLPTMVDVVARRGHLERAGVKLFAESFFQTLPDGPFDLAFCAGVAHTFDGERNRALYRNIGRALAPGGGVAIVTFLRRRNPLAEVFAVQMLANANKGDTHAESEYREWLAGAGFRMDDAVVEVANRPQSILFATAEPAP